MSALPDIHILAGQIITSGFQCRLAGVRQPSSVSATTWSSVCISASFVVINWLNYDIRAIERSAASLITASEQTIDWACWNTADVLNVCGYDDKMNSVSIPREWRAGTDEQLTRSLNSAVDRSRDLSAFRTLWIICLTHTVDNVAFDVHWQTAGKQRKWHQFGSNIWKVVFKLINVMATAVRVYSQLNNVWYS